MKFLTTCLLVAIGHQTALAQDDAKGPVAVDGLIMALAFSLEEGYAYDWRKERPRVTAGYIVVLKVDPTLVEPRQTAQPVLYLGNQTVERINHGYPSGFVIGIVPGVPDDPDHRDYLDLAASPIWFGDPNLPERIDAGEIALQKEKARRTAIEPFSAEAVEAALIEGGPPIRGQYKRDLFPILADLMRTYAPDEHDLIMSLENESR